MNSTRIISFAWGILVLGLNVLPAASQNVSDGEDFLEAVSAGNLARVRALLEAGVDIEYESEIGESDLIKASEGKNLPIVQILLDAGADINHQDSYGGTALISASLEGYLPIVQILLDAGADVELHSNVSKSATALFYAIAREHLEVEEAIRAAGDISRKEWPIEFAFGKTATLIEGMTQNEVDAALGFSISPVRLGNGGVGCPIVVKTSLGRSAPVVRFEFNGGCRLIDVRDRPTTLDRAPGR